MDLNFTPAEQAFRNEVRTFVSSNLPDAIRAKVVNAARVTKEEQIRWQQILHRQGWGAPNWPKEFGGTGWGTVEQFIFEEECAAAGAPAMLPFGLKMVGPVIMAFGNSRQKERFLPRIASAQDWWCQGYSEPGAGSDLASLKTSALRKGDHYVVNGQKTWITYAQHADWIFCLVRTDPSAKQQEGISFLLIDMKSPGVSVRPIATMGGHREVNEVWFEEVRVPVENRVGEENQGWTYAKYLLGLERTNIAQVGTSKRELLRLKRIASVEHKHGKPLIQDPHFATRVALVEIELMALEITNLRVLSAESERRAPGTEASLLKIRGSELQQAISELMMQALGPGALSLQQGTIQNESTLEQLVPPFPQPPAATYSNLRKTSIYAGSNEIQKNIIAHAILGR